MTWRKCATQGWACRAVGGYWISSTTWIRKQKALTAQSAIDLRKPTPADIFDQEQRRRQDQEQFAQQFETPAERFDRMQGDLMFRLAEGLDLETARRALTAGIIGRDAGRDIEPPQGPAAVTQGSQAAFALEQQRRTKSDNEKQLAAQKEANELLEEMLAAIQRGWLTPAPIGGG